MPLKPAETKRHKTASTPAEAYRVPMQVCKVRQLRWGGSYPVCPRCNSSLDREYMHYCDRCGQRLSWKYPGSIQVVRAV